MKQLLSITLLALLFSACGQQSQDTGTAAGDILNVTALLAEPEPMTDTEVTIEGTVTHVCKHGGRRLHLTDVESNEKIRVEAPEDLPAFARELEGSDIVVTGILRETRIDETYLDEWEQEIREAAAEEAAHDHAGQDLDAHEKAMNQGDGEHVAAGNDGHVEPQGMDAVTNMRKQLAESDKPYISVWHLDCVTYKMKDGGDIPVATPSETADHDHDHAH